MRVARRYRAHGTLAAMAVMELMTVGKKMTMAFRSVDLRLQRGGKLERTAGLGRLIDAKFFHSTWTVCMAFGNISGDMG